MTDKHLSDTRFQDLDIHEALLKGIASTGFEFCTPIQAMTLPIALDNRDVSGQAQTGTGKTAAFLIAAINRLLTNDRKQTDKPNPIRALVVAPTRELALQIVEDGKPLIAHTGLKMGVAYGGTDYEKQRKAIEQGVDILVGTPGRIIDYFKQNVFSLSALEVIVMDEADRMFDLGFIADIRYLFRNMPKPEERLNLLFSATLSHRVSELAYEHMREPEVVKIEAETITAERIKEFGYMPSNEDKIPLLLGLLKQANEQKCVVFVNTKHIAEKIAAWLEINDFKAALLSGDVPQRKRESLLKQFKEGTRNILLATDVAARGLHIPDVGLVINFDLPNDAEDYVHRIGRTARAGASGTAISLICETYAMNLLDIESYIEHSIPIEKDIDALLLKDAIKPNLSKLRNQHKKGPPERKNDKKFDKKTGKREPNNSRRNNKPGKPHKPHMDSPEAKDAANLAKLEKQTEHTNKPRKKSRIPLRGRRNLEIPAVG